MKFKNGFTLIELLVVIGILSVVFGLVLTIFTRVLQGGNKSQVISSIKQNGQAILEVMDKTIRGAERVVCASALGDTLVVVQGGVYTKFKFFAPTASANGYIKQEAPFSVPSSPPPSSDPNYFIRDFESPLCVSPLSSNAQTISDTNTQTGVSVSCFLAAGVPDCNGSPVFSRVRSSGFKDQIVIKFGVRPGVGAPSSVTGQIDDINFQTTIDIR